MPERRTYRLVHVEARRRAVQDAQTAPDGWCVTVSEPTRSLEQNAKFHAICSDMAKSGIEWMGKRRTSAQWKVLLVSGHAVATKEGAEVVAGIEGEFINIRESTALMSKKRSSSLVEYAIAFCATNDIP